MANNKKFNPIVSRIKLNPEQAVLDCDCYGRGNILGMVRVRRSVNVCMSGPRKTYVPSDTINPFNASS
jgi:hypothetical protein